MAAIEMQAKARARGRKLKPPTVKTRKSALSDMSTIIEVTAPDGSGLLIEVTTHRDHRGLSVRPYRADPNVAIQIGNSHGEDCWLLRRPPADDAVCTCGCDYRYDDHAYAWGPRVGLYYSVLVPWETDPAKRTEWHPTDAGFAPITRGSFDTEAEAHAWAKAHLGEGATYSLRSFERG